MVTDVLGTTEEIPSLDESGAGDPQRTAQPDAADFDTREGAAEHATSCVCQFAARIRLWINQAVVIFARANGYKTSS